MKRYDTKPKVSTIGTTYLGGRVVTERGDKPSKTAAKKLQGEKANHCAALVQVQSEGVRVVDSLTGETLVTFILKDIAYCYAFGGVFTFTVKDKQLGITTVHAFQLDEQSMLQLQHSVQEALKLAKEAEERSKNPFLAMGERETVTGPLFEKQIRRSDLEALMPVGAGQFGQVYLAFQQTKKKEKERRAVKTLRSAASEADRQEFMQEAELMLELNEFHMVQFIGVCLSQRPWLMVLEFLECK